MSKLITTEDGYEIRLGQKNPSCYPCCFEGFDVITTNGSRNPLFVN